MQLGKQPKPKKQASCIKKMGWGIFRAPHPHKKQEMGGC
jgi:hypothetical protein